MKKLVNYLGIKATIALFFVLIVIILFLGAMFYTEVLSNYKIISSDNISDISISDNSIEWTNLGNRNSDSKEEWIKININSNLESGTYEIIQTSSDNDIEEQRVYSIYISSLDADRSNTVEDYSSPTTVGGANGSLKEIEIRTGFRVDNYLYIKKEKGGVVGSLKIIMVED